MLFLAVPVQAKIDLPGISENNSVKPETTLHLKAKPGKTQTLAASAETVSDAASIQQSTTEASVSINSRTVTDDTLSVADTDTVQTVFKTDFTVESQNLSTVWLAVDSNLSTAEVIAAKPCVAFRALNIWGMPMKEARILAAHERNFIRNLRLSGISVSGMMGLIAIREGSYSEDFMKKYSTVDPLGRRITFDGSLHHGCLAHQEWRAELLSSFKILVDSGCNLVEIDQPALESWRGECYCNLCMENFRSYLEAKQAPEKLKEYYGINEIKKFDYREYLRGKKIDALGKSLAELSDGDRFALTTIGQEFFVFQIEDNLMNIARFLQDAREYARNRSVEVSIFGNIWGMAAEYLPPARYFDLLDVACDLVTPGDWNPDDKNVGPPRNSWVPVYKLASSFSSGKPLLSFLDTNGYQRGLKSFRGRCAFLDIISGEALGCGADFVFPLRNRTAPAQEEGFSSSEISSALCFYRENLSKFRKGSSLAEIAIFQNYPSRILDRFSLPYWGLSYLFLDNQLNFDTVFSGDGRIFADDLSVEKLSKYKLVFIPQSDFLTEHQEKVFWNYINSGGKVVFNGEKVFNHPNCAKVSESTYYSYYSIKDLKLETRILQAITTLLPNLSLKFDKKYAGLRSFPVESDGKKYLLLVNANYDKGKNAVIPFKDVTARCKVQTAPAKISYKTLAGKAGEISFLYRFNEIEFKLPEITDNMLITIE